jgi:hypothetical protein
VLWYSCSRKYIFLLFLVWLQLVNCRKYFCSQAFWLATDIVLSERGRANSKRGSSTRILYPASVYIYLEKKLQVRNCKGIHHKNILSYYYNGLWVKMMSSVSISMELIGRKLSLSTQPWWISKRSHNVLCLCF